MIKQPRSVHNLKWLIAKHPFTKKDIENLALYNWHKLGQEIIDDKHTHLYDGSFLKPDTILTMLFSYLIKKEFPNG